MAKQKKKTGANQIQCEDILCIAGENGRLGKGSFGVVRAGFFKNVAVAAKCSEYTGSSRILEKT